MHRLLQCIHFLKEQWSWLAKAPANLGRAGCCSWSEEPLEFVRRSQRLGKIPQSESEMHRTSQIQFTIWTITQAATHSEWDLGWGCHGDDGVGRVILHTIMYCICISTTSSTFSKLKWHKFYLRMLIVKKLRTLYRFVLVKMKCYYSFPLSNDFACCSF